MVGSGYSIFDFIVASGYWYFLRGTSNTDCTMNLLEASPSRTVIKTSGSLGGNADWAYELLASIYPTGLIEISFKLTQTDPSGTFENVLQTAMTLSQNWTRIADDDSTPTNNEAMATSQDWLAMYGSSAGSILLSEYNFDRQDILRVYSASGQYELSMRDTASHSWVLNETETWKFALYLRPDTLDDETTNDSYSDAFLNPDDLSFTTGSGWYDTDENTSSSTDEFNEAEGAYCIEASSNEVEFDIDGGTYTRYKPGFKIRNWRTTDEPALVTLESASQSSGTDYNADLKVFSEAWYDDNGTEDQIADGGDTGSADEYIGEASNNYTLTGFTTTDFLYLGSDDKFTGVNYLLATAGVGGAITWEYWDGDSWEDLTGVTGDDDLDSTDSNFYFTKPGDWAAYTLTSGSEGITGEREIYWIRADVTDAFETVPVIDRMWTDILFLQYLDDISSDNQTFYLSAVSNSAPNAPQTPYVNNTTAQSGQATPVTGLTDHTPAFSAIFDDDDTSDTAEYYEIDVGDDTNWEDTPELWDGAKTSLTSCDENDRCEDITYAGSALSDGTTYYWRIRFWDNSGEAGSWSSDQQFTMNTDPTVTNVSLNSGSDVDLTEGTTTEISWTATITDAEGYEEIASVNGVAYRSGVSGAESCTPNDNNCYQDADCALSNCSETTCTATCTINMQFHTEPTDAGTYSAEYWLGWMQATDDYSETGNGVSASDTTDVNSLTGISVDVSIEYGSLLAGEDTEDSNQTITVTNTGNTAIDNELSGDNLCTDYPTCSESSIAVGYQEYNLTGFTYGEGTNLTASPTTVQINLGKPTTAPSDSTDLVYWGIGIPEEKETGDYSGVNTVTAVSDS